MPQGLADAGAIVIVHGSNSGTKRLLFQRKTPGYPVEPYVGRLALIGGGRNEDDVSPRATLLREIEEELAPESLGREVAAELEFVAAYDTRLPELADGDDLAPAVRNFFFVADVGDGLADPALTLHEGDAELIAGPDALRERPCWGHEFGLLHWAGDAGPKFPHLSRDPTIDARLVTVDEPSRWEIPPYDDDF